jgi:hypothetical protein
VLSAGKSHPAQTRKETRLISVPTQYMSKTSNLDTVNPADLT